MYNKNNKIICSMCGEEIESSSLYCPKCGEKISSSKVNIENEINEYKKKMFREYRGIFIFVGIIILLSVSVALYQIVPFILEDFSIKNPVLLYLSATAVYLINLYTFQYKKKLQNFVYFALLMLSITYSVFFSIMIYNPDYGFIGLVGPLITVIMIFSPFIIGRKNITIR
jgi:predicted RNA-binding Zn-ribbon protein involved in translation (DUF1610 family)